MALAALTLVWSQAERRLEARIQAALESGKAAGYTATLGESKRSGWPFFAELDYPSINATGPAPSEITRNGGKVAFGADAIRIRVPLLFPSRMILIFPRRVAIDLAAPDRTIALTTDHLTITIRPTQAGTFSADALTATNADGGIVARLNAIRGTAVWRGDARPGDSRAGLDMSASRAEAPALTTALRVPSLSQFHAAIALLAPENAGAPMRLLIQDTAIDLGLTHASFAGAFTWNAPTAGFAAWPDGHGTLKLTNAAPFLQNLADWVLPGEHNRVAGLTIDAQTLAAMRQTLSRMAAGTNRIFFPVDIANGRLILPFNGAAADAKNTMSQFYPLISGIGH